MDVLKDKSYLQYDYISRYINFPYYYNSLDDKYIYGTTAQLNKDIPFTLYKTVFNDTFDSISLKFYGNPTYYWVICDFNNIQDPFSILEPNTQLKIPTLKSVSFNLTV